MSLLHSSPVAVAEFASLSLLIDRRAVARARGGGTGGGGGEGKGPPPPPPPPPLLASAALGEALTVVSPLATSAAPAAHAALEELHSYLADLLQEERRGDEDGGGDGDWGGGEGGDGGGGGGGGRADPAAGGAFLALLAAASDEARRKEELEEAKDGLGNGLGNGGGEGFGDGGGDGGGAWWETGVGDGDGDGDCDGARARAARYLELGSALRSGLLREEAGRILGTAPDRGPGPGQQGAAVRTYLPTRSGGGMGMHYVVLRDRPSVARLAALLMGTGRGAEASPAASGEGKGEEAKEAVPEGTAVAAAVLAVGMTGLRGSLGGGAGDGLALRFADAAALLSGLAVAAESGAGPRARAVVDRIATEARGYARTALSGLLLTDPDWTRAGTGGTGTGAAGGSRGAEPEVPDEDDARFFEGGSSTPSHGGGGQRGRTGSGTWAGAGALHAKQQLSTPRAPSSSSKKFSFSSSKDRSRRRALTAEAIPPQFASPRPPHSSPAPAARRPRRQAGPAERTRLLFDQFQVLGFAEADMDLPPYQARARLAASGKLHRRKRYVRGANPMDMGPLDLDAFAPPGADADANADANANADADANANANANDSPDSAPFYSPKPNEPQAPHLRAPLPGGSPNLPPMSPMPGGMTGMGSPSFASPPPLGPGSAPRLSGPRRDTTGMSGGLRPPPSRSARRGGHRRTPSGAGAGQPPTPQLQPGTPVPVRAEGPTLDLFAADVFSPAGPDPSLSLSTSSWQQEEGRPAVAETFDPFSFSDGAAMDWTEAGDQSEIQPLSASFSADAAPLPGSMPSTPHYAGEGGLDRPTFSFGEAPIAEPQIDEAESAALDAAVAASAVRTQLAVPDSRFKVHVALNEDLTCSYRDSKIASCSVEGVVQAQVKRRSENPDEVEAPPFVMYVRDPSNHIREIAENNNVAGDYFATVASFTGKEPKEEDDEAEGDRRFVVTLPKAGTYFPLIRYKCTSDLRPVPIRVQSRVRLSGNYVRVALQISSNPSNVDALTDLTIALVVPITVRGESVVTSPEGGIWDPSNRSVDWSVSELGEGEKFQLQAQFEIDEAQETEHENLPSFSVLVRCQCLYAQLSDVDLDVADVPELWPAEVSLKVARRFRLSHREKS